MMGAKMRDWGKEEGREEEAVKNESREREKVVQGSGSDDDNYRPVVGCWQPVRLGVWGCPMVGVKGTNLFVGYGQHPEKFRNLRC